LIGSLVQVLKLNLTRRASRVRVFELGRVFARDSSASASASAVAGVVQPMRLAALAYGPRAPLQWACPETLVDFFDMKGDLETLLAPIEFRFVPAEHPAFHPGRSAAVFLDGKAVGYLGELHPRWRQAYELPHSPVLFELDLAAITWRSHPISQPIPRQQSVLRDVALVASESVVHDDLIAALGADHGGLVRRATLFDVYKPASPTVDILAGERSLAIRLEIRSDEATLTDSHIDEIVAQALLRATKACGVRLRT
jgi:phenylalanyl-tRNA synthetase beta chain